MTRTDCYPWWHATLGPLVEQAWAKRTVPSGCSMDGTGNVPCPPDVMRQSAEAWIVKNAPEALPLIGGRLDPDVYTLARYIQSEVGSGTLEERVAVGELAINQARRRTGLLGDWRAQLYKMLLPKGKYGAIHAPEAYCLSLGLKKNCNPEGRWAATSRDPTIAAILIASFILNGNSGGFSRGAETQWGPEYLLNADGKTYLKDGTTPARVESFVRYAASKSGGQYYWVGPIPGIDPWHTWLAKKGPAADTPQGQALIAYGLSALPLDAKGKPIRTVWPSDLPICPRGPSTGAIIAGVGIAAALWYGAKWWTEQQRKLPA